MDSDNLRYPIGPCDEPTHFDPIRVANDIRAIGRLPQELRDLLGKADAAKLANRYRPGGWTALQVVHHMGDSHIHSYTRFKLALTEENPVIKPYDEGRWASLADYALPLMEATLEMLQGLHAKWVYLLGALGESEWNRTFFHPESGKTIPLYRNAAIYAWHGQHHLSHIKRALHAGYPT